jgi:ATP-dependent DNA helicase UvrD/PcrA
MARSGPNRTGTCRRVRQETTWREEAGLGMFHADLHIHSKFSRACSKQCDLEHLAWWALRKGVTVIGTGDFTHPAWSGELKENLVAAEPGLFRLQPDIEKRVRRRSPPGNGQPIRFMLSVEIATIYRRADRTRKVHHLLYAPTFAAADRITAALARIGNLAADGRPILGLDSRDLLEITLESDPGSYLVPAHVWTPWFAVLGSKSGFGSVAECYADLAGHVFAIETGLSSDPPMNWMCSGLDSYRLVSNSDAHSPPMLGREATTLTTDLDYFAIRRALETGDGLAGTIEFFPEEGKYHLDGHRKCGVRCTPSQTRACGGNCPECGKPLTVGVLHRVSELADREHGYRPRGAPECWNLVQLPQIVSELVGTGPKSKRVTAEVSRLVHALGPELAILRDVPADEIGAAGGTLLGEAIARLRRGEVIADAGYDGEYGGIRLLGPAEIHRPVSVQALFDAGEPGGAVTDRRAAQRRADPHRLPRAAPGRRPTPPTPPTPPMSFAAPGPSAPPGPPSGSLLDGLDQDQRAAAAAATPLLIVAGPGTGKTRTVTHRIAHLISECGHAPGGFLAITFTRRAAQELRDRLALLIPRPAAALVTVSTFHGLGLRILRENRQRAGLQERFAVADEAAQLAVAAELTGSPDGGRTLLASLAGRAKAADADSLRDSFRKALLARGLVDFDGLVELAGCLLRDEPELARRYRARWPHISVDEYQDIDAAQYALLGHLAGAGGDGLAVIGDPDQSIYGFRGADVGFFLRFRDDYPNARTAVLTTNYRSGPAIVAGALQAIAPATLVPGRELRPVLADPRAAGPITLHEAADQHAEAAWIAEAIDGLLGGSSFHSLDCGRADGHGHGGLGLSDIALLYRTDAQAGALMQALTRAGLPFQKRSHDRLADRPGVHLLARELRLANAADAAGLATDAQADMADAAQADMADAAQADMADAAQADMADAAQADMAGTGGEAGETGAMAVQARLRAAVAAVTAMLPATAPEATDVRAAADVLLPLARRCGSDLGRFLTEISLGAEADAADPRADAVALLTLHAAKGLEFPVVFIAGCEDGLLPPRWPDAAPGEERRLLFVGMTRARTTLLLTWARRRCGDRERPAGPSPFLTAISPDLTTRTVPVPRRRAAGRQLRLL